MGASTFQIHRSGHLIIATWNQDVSVSRTNSPQLLHKCPADCWCPVCGNQSKTMVAQVSIDSNVQNMERSAQIMPHGNSDIDVDRK